MKKLFSNLSKCQDELEETRDGFIHVSKSKNSFTFDLDDIIWLDFTLVEPEVDSDKEESDYEPNFEDEPENEFNKNYNEFCAFEKNNKIEQRNNRKRLLETALEIKILIDYIGFRKCYYLYLTKSNGTNFKDEIKSTLTTMENDMRLGREQIVNRIKKVNDEIQRVDSSLGITGDLIPFMFPISKFLNSVCFDSTCNEQKEVVCVE